MALAEGIKCDDAMLETLRQVLAKIPPKELEDYARSTPGFLDGGFRATKAPLLRARIISMLASPQPIDAKLRAILRDQVRGSLEAGGDAASIKRELDNARATMAVLKGAEAKREKETANRKALEAKVSRQEEQLEQLGTELRAARQELEVRTSEVRKLKGEIDRRVAAGIQVQIAAEKARHTREMLAHSTERIEAATPDGRIAAAIAACKDEELSTWRNCLGLMQGAKIFNPDELAMLEATLKRRYAGLHDGGDSLQEVLRSTEDGGSESILKRAIAGATSAILLIDAHNTLYSLQSRYRLPNDHRWPSAQARDWLVRDIAKFLADAQNIRAYIVFDGPERTENTASSNVMVIYSGGEGEHRADGVLVDQAAFLKASGAENMLIITNDGELSGLAARHGAKNLSPAALSRYL